MRTYEEFYPDNWEWRPAQPAYKRLVSGVGTNDADYATQPRINGKQLKCPAYIIWCCMLDRCYNTGFHPRRPTYVGTSVVESWLRFSNFREWYFRRREALQSFGYTGPLELDKDILSDSKTYSPKTCLLVPPDLNKLLNAVANRRGPNPIGVSPTSRSSTFRARVRIDGRREEKGGFDTPEEAAAWRLQKKLEYVRNYPLPPWLDETIVRRRLLKIVRNQK